MHLIIHLFTHFFIYSLIRFLTQLFIQQVLIVNKDPVAPAGWWRQTAGWVTVIKCASKGCARCFEGLTWTIEWVWVDVKGTVDMVYARSPLSKPLVGKLFCAEEIPRDKRGCSPSGELRGTLILVSPTPQLWGGEPGRSTEQTVPRSQSVHNKQIGGWG